MRSIGSEDYRVVDNILQCNFDFHDSNSTYSSHGFHSFPAKYPPQLPSRFIDELTEPNDIVLDPMMGSGTTILEAYLSGRQAIGFDIDPLAIKLARVKVSELDQNRLERLTDNILKRARNRIDQQPTELKLVLERRWDVKTKQFADYWFTEEIQLQLTALIEEIEQLHHENERTFFEVVFSAIIITKTGGVSLALDLAHTRPHRAKIVFDPEGRKIIEKDLDESKSARMKFITKRLQSAFDAFENRARFNIRYLPSNGFPLSRPRIEVADAQSLPLADSSVDLIVTSPPYASNAIDYMRAHKFSLIWLGYRIDQLGRTRNKYIGGDSTSQFEFVKLPALAQEIVSHFSSLDRKKGLVLHRYFSEITRVLKEMYRVLKPGKPAIVVVGNTTIRGEDTHTAQCLEAIGYSLGFLVPRTGIRNLDRNRRMLPASMKIDTTSQIQRRMHQEYIIGFFKS